LCGFFYVCYYGLDEGNGVVGCDYLDCFVGVFFGVDGFGWVGLGDVI